MSTDARQHTAEATIPRKTGRWIALGLVAIVLADGLIMLEDSGSIEFWPGAVVFAAFTTAISFVFVLPGYLLFSGVALLIPNRTKLSEAARKRCLLGPPLIVLISMLLFLANNARPSVAIRKIIPRGTPRNIRNFHYAHTVELMSSRHIAWFDVDPAQLRVAIRENELTETNGINLSQLLRDDRIIRKTSIPDQIPEIADSVCYLHDWHEFNFSTRKYLFTTPAHDKAVWYYTHDR